MVRAMRAKADAKCTSASISKLAYRWTSAASRPQLYVPLQCLLKQQGLYTRAVTGTWNKYTLAGLQAFQKRVGHRVLKGVARRDWVSLVTAGNSGTVLRLKSEGPDVVRLQRGINAASGAALKVNGVYGTATKSAVSAYQRRVGISRTGNVASLTWAALRAGRF